MLLYLCLKQNKKCKFGKIIIIKLNLIYFAVYCAILVNKQTKNPVNPYKNELENNFLLCSPQVPSALPHRLSF